MNISKSQPAQPKPASGRAVCGFSLPLLDGPAHVRWAAFCVVYTAAALVSEMIRPALAPRAPLWLPAGLLIVVLLAAPRRHWAGYLAFAAALSFGLALRSGASSGFAAVGSLGVVLEALISVWGTTLWVRSHSADEAGGAIGLLAVCALPGPAVGAALVVIGCAGNSVPSEYLAYWLDLWCRDVLAILIFLPLAMGAAAEWRRWATETIAARRTEVALLLAVALADTWLVFGLTGSVGGEVRFLLAPLFVWAAMRLQARGVALVSALISLTLFALATVVPNHIDVFTPGMIAHLQVFLVVSTATALMISIAWNEYQNSAGSLLRLQTSMTEIVVTVQVVRDEQGAIADFMIVDVNPAFLAASKITLQAAVGALLSEFVENPSREYGEEADGLLRDRRPRTIEVHSPASGRWYQVSAYASEVEDRIATLSTDITALKEREAEVVRYSRMYSMVSQINQSIVRSAKREDLLRNVCVALTEHGRFVAAWAGRFRSTENRLIKVHASGAEPMFAELQSLPAPADEMLARRAFREGAIVVCMNPGDDPTAQPWGAVAARHGMGSLAAFPLREDGRVVGAVFVCSGDAGAFSSKEVDLLGEVARDIGFALDKMRGDAIRTQTMANLVESDRRFRGLFDQAPVAYQALDGRGVLVDVNPAWLALFKETRPEAIGRPFLDFVGDEQREGFVQGFAALVSNGGERTLEFDLVRADGEGFAAQVAIRVQGDAEGRFQLAHCIVYDVSERIRYERSLREGEERIKTAFEIANDGIWEANLRTGRLSLSHRFYTMLGYQPGEFDETPRQWIDRIHPEDAAGVVARYPAFLASGEDNFEIEYRLRDKSGAWRWIRARGRVVEKGPAGEKVRILGTNSDITLRKRSELALRESERRLAFVIEGSALAAWDWDLHSGEILFNAYWARLTGNGDTERIISADERKTYLHPQDFEMVAAAFNEHLQGRRPYFECEYRVRRGDGTWLWVYDRGQVIARDGVGGPLRAAGTLRDITDRRLAEMQVREQAALLDQTDDIVLTVDAAGSVRFANRSAEVFFGVAATELRGRRLTDLFDGVVPTCDATVVGRVLAEGEWKAEFSFERGFRQGHVLDGRWSIVHSEADASVLILLVCTDITERRLLESRFLRAQRMESIGSLASGVAHDLNNIFLPISLAAHILKKSPPEDQRASLYAMLDQSAQRGADLVQQLLTFGRGFDGRRVELQPRMLFHEIRRIIRETFPKNIVLETELPEDLWTVSADPTQLHQVLLNLCLNARDAMGGGGTLSLTAENVVFDEHYAAMNPEAEPGPHVILEVGDTGIGIPPENLEKIFDPFFTTKEPGVGTGLGLSTVHGIVKGHGGFIQVRSRVGEGAVFKVYLPAIPSPLEVQEIPASEDIPMGAGETILVVDDEEAVRETLRHMLENHGYRVILAPDGRQGLVCYTQQRQQVRVLVTDIMMPVMDGTDLIRALRRIDETLPVIAMSGLPEKEVAASEGGIRANAFIMKPFVSEQLLVVLHSMLAPRLQETLESKATVRP